MELFLGCALHRSILLTDSFVIVLYHNRHLRFTVMHHKGILQEGGNCLLEILTNVVRDAVLYNVIKMRRSRSILGTWMAVLTVRRNNF